LKRFWFFRQTYHWEFFVLSFKLDIQINPMRWGMTYFKSIIRVLAVATTIVSLAELAQAGVYTPVDSSYKLTFDEEFNGSAVNSSKWGSNWLGGSGQITKPVNSYEIGAYDPAQCTVTNGQLQMKAVAKRVTASDSKVYDYASCLVNTNKAFTQAYGYFEARMYLPGSAGKISNWPAFWTDGTGSWPTTGEMDIMEGLSGYAQYHFHSPSTGAGGGPRTDYTGWHIFAALWEPGSVTYFYDGVQVGRLTTGITSAPMYVILNNGVSPENKYGGPMQIPATVLVDYVHVYSKSSSAVAVTPETNYGGPGDTGENPLDTTAPSIPQNLIGSASSTSQINLVWSASNDFVGVSGYNVYRNGLKLSYLITEPRFSDTGLSANTSYTYQVTAYDAAGNVSEKSSMISVTTQAVQPPPPPPPPPPPTSTNLVLNAGFESGTQSWKYYGVARLDSKDVYAGTQSAYIEKSSAFEQIIVGLSPNTTYILRAHVKKDSSSSNVALGVKDFGSSQIAASASSTSYEKMVLTFKTGASNTSAKIFFYGNSGSGHADNFVLIKAP
jgi:beta-glucanase (GH16 family)